MAGYAIHLKPAALKDMDKIRKYDAPAIADAMEKHLTTAPTRESKSRIKRLRGIEDPDYRHRVGDTRIFYTVSDTKARVDVIRVMHKEETAGYYEELES